MNKLNCWDFMKCGKGPSGRRKSKSSSCPISKETSAHGLNGGVNAGRICWIMNENGTEDKVKCSNIYRKNSCFQCEFRYKVMAEEGLLNVCNATGTFLERHF